MTLPLHIETPSPPSPGLGVGRPVGASATKAKVGETLAPAGLTATGSPDGHEDGSPRPSGDRLTIIVFGHPAPQGSKRHVGHGVMVESSKHVKPWRQDVVAVARDAIDDWRAGWLNDHWRPLDGPLTVRMVFTFTRPRSHYRTGRNAHLLRDSAPLRPCGPPDLSKLARSTEDALTTALAWRDDSRVVEYERLAKVYVGEDPDALTSPGARIEIRRMPDA